MCRRRVAPLMVQFPPFAGGEVAVRAGVAPASQTISAKDVDNGVSYELSRVLWLRWSALWPRRRLDLCVACTFALEM